LGNSHLPDVHSSSPSTRPLRVRGTTFIPTSTLGRFLHYTHTWATAPPAYRSAFFPHLPTHLHTHTTRCHTHVAHTSASHRHTTHAPTAENYLPPASTCHTHHLPLPYSGANCCYLPHRLACATCAFSFTAAADARMGARAPATAVVCMRAADNVAPRCAYIRLNCAYPPGAPARIWHNAYLYAIKAIIV